MKRSGIDIGPKARARRSAFKSRGEGPKRKHGLKRPRSPRKRRFFRYADDTTQALMQGRYEWNVEATKHPCRVCGAVMFLTGHHVITKQKLRSLGRETYLRLKWDRRNLMTLCFDCHERHHNASRRVPPELLSDDNLAFADELGLGHYLDRYYPGECGA